MAVDVQGRPICCVDCRASGMPLSFQSRAKTKSGPIRRTATGSVSPALCASMTAKFSQCRNPERNQSIQASAGLELIEASQWMHVKHNQ